jgi:hypothetical protein
MLGDCAAPRYLFVRTVFDGTGIGDRGRRISSGPPQPTGLGPLLVVATPTLQVQGIAGNFGAGVSRTALALGVVVEDQNRMRIWNDYGFPVATPPLALTGTPDDSAIVGTGLARTLQAGSRAVRLVAGTACLAHERGGCLAPRLTSQDEPCHWRTGLHFTGHPTYLNPPSKEHA